ncbi:hypothetical protein LFZ32_22760 [Salmonella enterica subsp. enterica serovar Newport str. L0167]|nr:hypothetical protein LFZ32_22760 [Salmonella enterica subsp. enterica serovar Newport str. L0167]
MIQPGVKLLQFCTYSNQYFSSLLMKFRAFSLAIIFFSDDTAFSKIKDYAISTTAICFFKSFRLVPRNEKKNRSNVCILVSHLNGASDNPIYLKKIIF